MGGDRCATRHAGHAQSQRKRKRIEEVFGSMKTVGLLRKTRRRGQRRVGWGFTSTAAASDRVRLRKLAVAARGRSQVGCVHRAGGEAAAHAVEAAR